MVDVIAAGTPGPSARNRVAAAGPAGCNGTVRRRSTPPESIDAGLVLLRREQPADAPALAAAVRDSLGNLEPWMPWATPDAATVESQAARGAEAAAAWERGTDFVYLLRPPAGGSGAHPAAGDEPVLGVIGLHRRIGPGGIEIGYWTHTAHQGRGYMGAAAKAATEAAAGLAGVRRVEIHTDEANRRSAAIPQKLGFRLDRVDVRPPQAPAETGRLQIWIRP
jgi:RimJ/RimL family protein N-acetyltransferase